MLLPQHELPMHAASVRLVCLPRAAPKARGFPVVASPLLWLLAELLGSVGRRAVEVCPAVERTRSATTDDLSMNGPIASYGRLLVDLRRSEVVPAAIRRCALALRRWRRARRWLRHHGRVCVLARRRPKPTVELSGSGRGRYRHTRKREDKSERKGSKKQKNRDRTEAK